MEKTNRSEHTIPIKAGLTELGIVQREAAAALRIPLSTFNMKLLAKRRFTPEEQSKLANLPGKPVGHLFPQTNNKEGEQITQGLISATG